MSVGAESTTDSEDEFKQVPVTLALTITFSWIFFCASLFLIWEKDWSYFQAFYFFFVSLSTIGLGDITPTKPRYMVMNFGLVIIGLSLVSMTLSVIQINIESYLYRVLMKIQQEYAAAVEAGEEVDKNQIANRVLGKQPWFMKRLAPMVMTHTQKQHLDEIVTGTGPSALKINASVQCGPPASEMKNSPVSDNKSFKTVASQAQSLVSKFDAESEYEFDQFVPAFLKQETAVQTDEIIEHVAQEVPKSPPPLVTVQVENEAPHDLFIDDSSSAIDVDDESAFVNTPRPPDVGQKETCDAETQVSILITSVDPPRIYHMVEPHSLRLIDDMVFENNQPVTSREIKCLMETAVQTDDSYLKLARKLETLKMNRAKSLAIWVSPVARKPKRSPPPDDSTTGGDMLATVSDEPHHDNGNGGQSSDESATSKDATPTLLVEDYSANEAR